MSLLFSKDVDKLPSLLEEVLSDLGSAVLGELCHRASNHNNDEFCVDVISRPYSALEVLLGDSDFTFAIDAWALGCLGVEIIQGKRLLTSCSRSAPPSGPPSLVPLNKL